MLRKIISYIIILILSGIIGILPISLLVEIMELRNDGIILFLWLVVSIIIYTFIFNIYNYSLKKYRVSVNRLDSFILLLLINFCVSVMIIQPNDEEEIFLALLMMFFSLILYELVYKSSVMFIKGKYINELIKYNALFEIGVLSQEEFDAISKKIKEKLMT